MPTKSTTSPASVGNRLRHVLGLRQWFVVDGVRYREVTSDSMRRAMSRKGSGFKDYDTLFPDSASMQIRATPDRTFADITGTESFAVYTRAERLLLPGMRVLILGGGTGYPGSWTASRVAPSGAVVSLESDEQSVEYARHRYRIANVSFEQGAIADLSGETDGGFDAVLAVNPDSAADHEPRLTELWRLVAPGGWLLSATATGPDGDALLKAASLICRSEDESTMSLFDRSEHWTSAVFRRPVEE